MRHLMSLLAACAALLLAIGGCSDSSSNGSRDGSTERDGTPSNDGPSLDRELQFSKVTLDKQRAGSQAQIAGRGNEMGIAYFRKIDLENPEEVVCPASPLRPGGQETAWVAQDIMYVHFDGTDWGAPVKVETSIAPKQGVSLIFDRAGHQHVGYLGGEMSTVECYSSDAMVATSNSGGQIWSHRTVDGGGSGIGGDTCGYWMSLAEDCDGAVQAAYRDVHFGYYEGENGRERADWRFSGTTIKESNGDGEFNVLLYDQDCHPVVLGFSSVKTGFLGGIRLAVQRGSVWDITQVAAGGTSERPGFATDGNGLFAAAYYDPAGGGTGALYYKESNDLAKWSEKRFVDPSAYSHGKYASLAFDQQGNPAVSYYRSGPAGSSGADFTEDALMFAYRIDGTWKVWEVDTGGDYACGRYTSLRFNSHNQPVIAYECTIYNNIDERFDSTLKVALGQWQ
jgi:hypothetical protein